MATSQILSTLLPVIPARAASESAVGSTLVRGALGSLLVQCGGVGAAFASQVGLAHLLGAVAFWQYVYVITWASLLAIVARGGLDFASIRFIPEYRTQAKWGLLRGFVSRSIRTGTVVAGALGLAGVALGLACAQLGYADLLAPILLGAALLTVLSLQGLFTAQLRALKRVSLGQMPIQLLSPLGVVVLTFVTVSVIGRSGGSVVALTASLLVNAVLMLGAGILAGRELRNEYGDAKPQYDSQIWRACSLSMLIVGVLQIINLRVDLLMVGALCGMQDAAVYAASAQIASLTLVGLMGVNAIAAPMISELHAKRDHTQFQHFLSLATLGICVLTLPLAALLIGLGTWLLGLFGSGFATGYPVLVTLVIGQAAGALLGPVGVLAIMTGNQREGAWIFGTGAVLNIGLNAVLIPRFGLVGAAASTAIATGGWKLLMVLFVIKRLKVNPTVFASLLSRYRKLHHRETSAADG